ncbi:TonB-dependent receptor [Candidatus Colwellia aromaticivorans]|uniref:TonB-dependent receptor n=1 Tax=Candidatus Colwellia aromaticivorans TaxID=2267621 RepID=UPI001FEA72DD|nr:TonB-dependent receptor [Candidatus Colwellia aromaticivorans]
MLQRFPISAITMACFSMVSCSTLAATEKPEISKSNSSDGISEVIVVTGTLQQSDLLTLAGNIDRISSDDIASVSAVHPSDILNRATGVHIQTNNGMESLPSLRSPVLTGPGAAGAFLFLEEGIATRSAGFANNNALSELNLAQAKEVEIIRGPASAVYGSNAVHGVVNALTKAPRNGGDATLIVGPNDRYQLQGTLGSESDNQGVSGNFQAIDDGGYRDDSDFTSLKLGLRHDYVNGDDQFKTIVSGFILDQNTAGFISSGDNGSDCYSSTYSEENLYKDSNAMEKNCDTDAYREWSSVRIATSWQRELSDDRSFTMTPYFRVNQMEFRQHYLPSKAIEENSHYSVGMINSYNWQVEQNFALVMGIDFEWTEGELTQTQEKPDSYSWGKARQQGLHYDYKVDASTIAPYVQADLQLTEQLKFTGSVRFDATQYRYDNLIADGTTKADGSSCVNNNDEPIECLYKRPSDSNDSFDNTSTKLGFNYRLNNDIAFFGSWSQGFRAPQTTDMYRLQKQQLVGEIESEQLDSAELGVRGVSSKLTYEVVVYSMNKDNFFFRDAQGLNVTDGETSHKGLELSINYDLTEQLSLAVNYSYGQHEYEFDQASSGVIKGNKVDTAPEQLANVRLAWQPTDNSKLELEWLHMGEYYLDPANEHDYAGHDLLQLRGSVALNNKMNLFARIENLTDEKYASRADYAFGSYRFFGGQPRALHLGASISF